MINGRPTGRPFSDEVGVHDHGKKNRVLGCWYGGGRLREGAESYAKALASDILR